MLKYLVAPLSYVAKASRRFEELMKVKEPIGPVSLSLALVLFACGNSIDVAATYFVLNALPAAYEANPIARLFLVWFGYGGLAVHKVAMFGLITMMGITAHQYRYRWLILAYSIGGLGSLVAGIHNLALVL